MSTQPMSDPYSAYGGRAIAPPPAQPSGQDPYAAYGGSAVRIPAPVKPASVATPTPVSASISSNENGEGIYQMTDPSGRQVAIPYSKVSHAHDLGYNFAAQDERTKYARDFAADPVHEGAIDHYLKNAPWYDPAANAIGIMEGIGSGAEGTVAGIDRIAHRVTGERPNKGDEAFQNEAARPNQRWSSTVGEGAEAAGEFFTGEELLSMLGRGVTAAGKGAGIADRLAQAQQLAKVFNANPAIAKLVKIGQSAVRNFMISGGQTYAKTGGDAGQALETGGITAGAGAALEGTLAGASRYLKNNASTFENVGGEQIPVPAAARNLKISPEQQSGQRAIEGAAKNTARAHLEELNETRTPPPGRPELPAKTGPFEFNLRGTKPTETQEGNLLQPAQKSVRLPGNNQTFTANTADQIAEGTAPRNQGGMGTDVTTEAERPNLGPQAPREDIVGGGGTLKTQDPNIATQHIENLNNLIESDDFRKMPRAQQQEIMEARADAQRQTVQYHQNVLEKFPGYQKPGLQPVDIEGALKRVGSYTDAADVLEGEAKKGYDLLNDVTGGRFAAIRQANKDAWRAYAGASGVEAQQAAEHALDTSNRQMDQLMHGLRGVVSDRELDGFNDAFRHAQALRRIGNAIDQSFSGNPSASARSFEYRGFNGQTLMNNLNRLDRTMGRPSLERIVGKDNLSTLYRVAELNRTQAQRAKFGLALKPVADQLMHMHVGPIAAGGYLGHLAGIPWEAGAAAGWAASAASKRVMDAVLTNPKVAQNLIFAMESGARPEHYAPMIAGMIQEAQHAQEEHENE